MGALLKVDGSFLCFLVGTAGSNVLARLLVRVTAGKF